MFHLLLDFLGYCYSILAGLGKFAFTVELGEALDFVNVAVPPILVQQGNPFNDYVFILRKPNGGVVFDVISWIIEKIPFLGEFYDYPVWIGLFLVFVSVSAIIAVVNFVKALLP